MNGPLADLTVLDMTIARAGPTAVRLLTDWGARVIKVEQRVVPGSGSITGGRRGPDEQNLHRNKEGLAIDLKNPAGHAAFMRLVREADIVVENFRADVKHRLKIDYDTLREINPRLIYASISGFGQDGPYAARPGVDQIVQGMSGLMSVTGTPQSGPTRAGIAISDTTAGMFLGQGILLALLHRQQTGEGQWVHTSLLEGMMNKLDFQGARYTMRGEVPQPQGNDHPYQVPMGTYPASDGQVNLAAPTQRMWERLCKALGADALFADPEFLSVRDRASKRDATRAAIAAVTARFTVAELIERLNAAGVPCGPINTIGEAFEDPQVRHLCMATPVTHAELGDIDIVRSPINLSAFPHPPRFDSAAPDPGQDTEGVLASFGLDADEIAALREASAI
ncbi:MAG: CaiB/BaiF CoA-transferase family protein [Pseudomonadota bacterium]